MRSTSCAPHLQFCISMLLLVIFATIAQSRTNGRGQTSSFGRHVQPFRGMKSTFTSRQADFELIRGGATEEECDEDLDVIDEYDDEDDEDEEEAIAEAEEDEEEEEYDDETYDDEEAEEEVEEGAVAEGAEGEYVEPYFQSPMTQMYVTLGCMMLSRRIDFFSPLVVRLIRFLFIAQIVIQQLFIFYVRLMAKKNNDRTPVTVNNPLSAMLQSQLEQKGGGNAMVKNLASSFLTSASTVMEYDMKQAINMQGGVFFNMAFMWLIHFKMEKVQPLVMQVVTGYMQLAYSPLFQIYVLGRNLERPFKTPVNGAQKMMDASKASDKSDDEEDSKDDEEEADEKSAEEAKESDDDEGEDEGDEEEEDNEDDGDEEDKGDDNEDQEAE